MEATLNICFNMVKVRDKGTHGKQALQRKQNLLPTLYIHKRMNERI